MPSPGSPQNHSTLRSLTICAGADPEVGGRLLERHLAAGLDVGHQGEQPADLVACAGSLSASRLMRHLPRGLAQPSTTDSRTSCGA